MITPPVEFEEIPLVYQNLLRALHNYFESEHSDGRIEESDIPKLKHFLYSPGLARAGLKWLVEKELLSLDIEHEDRGRCAYWYFTPRAAELVYSHLLLAGPQSPDAVAESNRFVELDHQSESYNAAQQAISELAEAIRGSNELFADPHEKLAVLSEIRGFSSILSGDTIRLATVWIATRSPGVLGWLAHESASAIVRSLATKAVRAVLDLIAS